MSARHLTARAPRPTGAISWVGFVLIGCAAAALYLGWVWVPVYSLHYDVKQTVRSVGNEGIHEKDDAKLQASLSKKLAGLESMEAPGEDGRLDEQPVVNVAPQDMVWERTQTPPSLHVAFGYDRAIHYPVIDRWTWTRMEVDMNLDLERPNWNTK